MWQAQPSRSDWAAAAKEAQLPHHAKSGEAFAIGRHGKCRQPRRLIRRERHTAPSNPYALFGSITCKGRYQVERTAAQCVMWSPLESRGAAVWPVKDDPRMMGCARVDQFVSQLGQETMIGGEKDITGLGYVGLCRAPQLIVHAEGRLIHIRQISDRAGIVVCQRNDNQ